MKPILLIALLIPCFLSAQTGTISGNAYWEYNKYVGNRADAGSIVLAYPADTTADVLKTNCDLQGNFKFDGVTGKYLVVVISENTRANPDDNILEFIIAPTRTYLGFSISSVNRPLYDSLKIYKAMMERDDKLYDSITRAQYDAPSPMAKMTMWNIKKSVAASQKQQAEFDKQKEEFKQRSFASGRAYHDAINRLYEAIPKSKRLYYFQPLWLDNKIEMKEVDVKPGKTETIVVDFGNTYY